MSDTSTQAAGPATEPLSRGFRLDMGTADIFIPARVAHPRPFAAEEDSVTSLVQIDHALRVSCDRLERKGLDCFLETIVRHAVVIAGASAGWLALPSADETRLELVGPFEGDIERSGHAATASPRGALPLAGLAREVWDATRHAGELQWLRLDGRRIPATLRAWCERRDSGKALLAPIRLGGAMLGHLGLAFGSQGGLSGARLDAARVLAQQSAVAIRMQRLGDSAREAASRSATEAERARLAGEIHDGLAQTFLAVIMQARAARLGGHGREQRLLQALEQIERLAAGGLEDARRSAFALRAIPVESDGLIGALERLIGGLSIPGRTQFILLNRAGAPSIPPAVEDAVYRIVQEATQNALKHAGAREVAVRLDEDDGRLRVCIEDDGEGIADDVIQRARERGGLRAMRERAERCGGSVVVEPCVPRGTRIQVLLPMGNRSK